MATATKEHIAEGLRQFLANRYWRRIYENAPDDAKHLFYDDNFANSVCKLSKEEKEADDGWEDKMSDEGWDYIINNSHNAMEKYFLKKAREEHSKRK